MTTFDHVIMWTVLLYVLASPFLAAVLALRLCRRNFDCPIRRENAASAWTAELAALRAKGRA